MYANLLVRVGDRELVAHQVLIIGPHAVEIHLDDPDSSYAETMGVTTVDTDTTGPVRITANF